MKRSWMAALAVVALTSGAPALAGGGGGGSSSSPSSSGPSYDPVEEYQTGLQALRDGEYRDAERAFERVVRVARTDANSHYLLGLAHLGQEEFRAASRALEKAVRYDKTLYAAHAKLGVTYLNMDKAEEAEEVLADLAAAQSACATTCEKAASIDAAIAEITAARSSETTLGSVDLTPSLAEASLQQGDVLYSEALRLINLERYDEAISELKTASAILGPHPDVLTYIGFANRKSGNIDEAYAYYSAALTIAPDHLSANEYLGEFYVEQGNIAAAYGQLDKLEALCPFGCAQTEELRSWLGDRPA
ncbi:MAG: tetratricopeptide repeat protein [Pseudomonadota bacterium]